MRECWRKEARQFGQGRSLPKHLARAFFNPHGPTWATMRVRVQLLYTNAINKMVVEFQVVSEREEEALDARLKELQE